MVGEGKLKSIGVGEVSIDLSYPFMQVIALHV
jgi:hypothetical protein